ncbi:MerR family DNA-binding transcriptional regulator [Caulobacter sp. S45]|uniref:MerR family transcriptional regulator n=1 Tax=Caulobacter sp. S45 TaxID=1641861 RepID=UPI0015756F1C|nr:MerR family DNA-binding transcriptional regulator [Caulobacter sp. S45]
MAIAQAAEDLTARLLTITELAEQLGVTARAIRFYEDKGLISPARAGATRVYTRRELARMQLILRGKRLGFSLRDIKQFLDLYDHDPTHVEQRRQLLARVRHRIEELEKTRAAVTETLAELGEIEQQTLRALAETAT